MLPHFRHQAVRDLAWACFGPALIRFGSQAPVQNCAPRLSPTRRRWLQQLDAEPEPLLQYIGAPPPARLGLYFERLWQFFLNQDPATEIIAHNLPVRDGGRTLGEFDCIYFCKRQRRYVHLELAVKYYLGHGGLWLGPNTRDRLDIKLTRLLQHQALLSQREPARELLHSLGISSIQPAIALKGWLFQPLDGWQAWPEGYARRGAAPRWMHLSQAEGALRGQRYRLLERREWLSPAVADGGSQRPDALLARLPGQFAAGAAPQLVAEMDSQGHETRRLFMAPDHWPHPRA